MQSPVVGRDRRAERQSQRETETERLRLRDRERQRGRQTRTHVNMVGRCRRQKWLPGKKHWECILPRKETLQSRKGSVIFLGKLHWRQENNLAAALLLNTTISMYTQSGDERRWLDHTPLGRAESQEKIYLVNLGAGIAQLVVLGLAVHSVEGSILLRGNFPVEGIFPLELTWVQTPLPKTLSDESINQGLVCAHMHFIARTQKILTFMS